MGRIHLTVHYASIIDGGQYGGDVAKHICREAISRYMGERKCAFEGCNALEFRTNGYCLRHKDEHSKEKTPAISKNDSPVSTNMSEGGGDTGFEWSLFLIGIPVSFFGYRCLRVESTSSTYWYAVPIDPIVQICGIVSLLIGLSFLLSPLIDRFGFGFDNSSPAKPYFDPSTGMFYFPADQGITEVSGSSEE